MHNLYDGPASRQGVNASVSYPTQPISIASSKLNPNAYDFPGVNPKVFENIEHHRQQFLDNEDLVAVENFFDEETFAKIAKVWDRFLWSV